MSEVEGPPVEDIKDKSTEQRKPLLQQPFNRRQILAAAAGFVGGALLTATGVEAYRRGDNSEQTHQPAETEPQVEKTRQAELFLSTINVKVAEPLHFRSSAEKIDDPTKGQNNEVNFEDFAEIYGVPVPDGAKEFSIFAGEIEDAGNLPGKNPSYDADNEGGKWLKLRVKYKNGKEDDAYLNLSHQTQDFVHKIPPQGATVDDAYTPVEIRDNQVYLEGSNNPEPFMPNQVTFEPTPIIAQQ